MDESIFEPLKEYNSKYAKEIVENSEKYVEELIKKTNTDVQENEKTVSDYNDTKLEHSKKTSKLVGFVFLKVFLIIITIISFIVAIVGGMDIYKIVSNSTDDSLLKPILELVIGILFGAGIIVLICMPINRKIKLLRLQASDLEKALNELYANAQRQVQELLNSFDYNSPLEVIRQTTPIINLDDQFDIRKHNYMEKKYGMQSILDDDYSIYHAQSGTINGNPFLYQVYHYKKMYEAKYEGSITIYWTTYSTDSQGRSVAQNHSQVLTATVTAPAPAYRYLTYLRYGNDAAPDLSFSREPSNASGKSQKQIDKMVKKGKKKLNKLTKESLKSNVDHAFTQMDNSEFDVLFGATDRDNEVQFRLLFTPLAQKNLIELIKSSEPFGDDFIFEKENCINTIMSEHSQTADLFCNPSHYQSIDVNEIKSKFVNYVSTLFKNIYFDLAPIMSIPLYQMHKPIEYIYDEDFLSNYSSIEEESMANAFQPSAFAHPETTTETILKVKNVGKENECDIVDIAAFSYKGVERVTYVSVWGNDGRSHNVPVHWIEYLPLTQNNKMLVAKSEISRKNYIDDVLSNDQKFDYIRKLASGSNIVFQRGFLGVVLQRDVTTEECDTLSGFMKKQKIEEENSNG